MGKNRKTGQHGETLAATFLSAQHYDILERNWTHGHKEIDLICHHEGTTVFVEVKTRRSTRMGLPEESVSEKKVQAVTAAAEEYLLLHPSRDIRFDVIAIVLLPGREPDILHIRDAFY